MDLAREIFSLLVTSEQEKHFIPPLRITYAVCCSSQEFFREVTGLPISTYFSGTKFKWMVENVPEVKQAVDSKTCCFGTIDSWIIYNLTGGADEGIHVTDGEAHSSMFS